MSEVKPGTYRSHDDFWEIKIYPFDPSDAWIDIIVKEGDEEFMANYSQEETKALIRDNGLAWIAEFKE